MEGLWDFGGPLSGHNNGAGSRSVHRVRNIARSWKGDSNYGDPYRPKVWSTGSNFAGEFRVGPYGRAGFISTNTSQNSLSRGWEIGGASDSYWNDEKEYGFILVSYVTSEADSGTTREASTVFEFGGASRGMQVFVGQDWHQAILKNDSDHEFSQLKSNDRSSKELIRIALRFNGPDATFDAWVNGKRQTQITGTGSSITTHSNEPGVGQANGQGPSAGFDTGFSGWIYQLSVHFNLADGIDPFIMTNEQAEEWTMDPWQWCRPKRKLFFVTATETATQRITGLRRRVRR